ncbi:MAG: TolC family protein [Verrucomicrobia bacterium]|nr:TolC family protein [Verrucomicrobiota bacterium]
MPRFILTLFALMLTDSLRAETVTLASVPAKVRSSNPSLAAARLRIDEARGRLLGAGRLTNPELGLGYLHDSRFGEAKAAVSFDQKFPVTARLRLEKSLSQKLVTAAELELRDAERQLIAEAQALAVKLLSIEQQRTLRVQQTELAQKLSSFAEGRAAAGEISALDAAQAQVDSQRLLLEGNKLETARVSLIGELKPKLGVAADDSLSIIGDLPATTMPARGTWERRADYQLALVNESAARSGIDLAKSKKWEDISAGIVWEGERMEDAPNGLENTGFFGLKVSIPLPFWNKNQGEIAEKSAAAQRAILETKALVADITNEAAAARAEMEANVKLATETKEKLLPLVLQQTERLEKAYQTGQTDLLTVLRAREQRLQLESAVIDAVRDFHLARIRYEAATGQHAPAAKTIPPQSHP